MPVWYILITIIAISLFGLFFGLALGRWLHTQDAQKTLGKPTHPWVERGLVILGGGLIVGLVIWGGQEGQGFLTLMVIMYVVATLAGLVLWMITPLDVLFELGLRLRPRRAIRAFWEIRQSLEAGQRHRVVDLIMETRRRRRAADRVLGEQDYYHPARREESLEQAFGLRPRPSDRELQTEARKRVLQACQILGVEPGDKLSTIKKKYRRLVRQHHPDRPEVEDDKKLRQIIEAWKTLRRAHPEKQNPSNGG